MEYGERVEVDSNSIIKQELTNCYYLLLPFQFEEILPLSISLPTDIKNFFSRRHHHFFYYYYILAVQIYVQSC